MATNDYDTDKMYCPIAGFNPPCGCCMWHLRKENNAIICSIPTIGLKDASNMFKDDLYVLIANKRKVDDLS